MNIHHTVYSLPTEEILAKILPFSVAMGTKLPLE
jgi:hypothetical protein